MLHSVGIHLPTTQDGLTEFCIGTLTLGVDVPDLIWAAVEGDPSLLVSLGD